MKIAFIGGGNMASALYGGMIANGTPAQDILVIDPNESARRRAADAHGVRTAAAADAALREMDVVVFAVKPQVFRQVAAQSKDFLAQALVVSIAAGIRLGDIARWLGDHARVIRAMPNTPALIGRGITGLAASAGVQADDRRHAETVLASVGEVLWCEDDAQIDAVTAISGSGPAYVFFFIEALQRAAGELGFDAEQARRLALGTFSGAAELAAQSEESASVLRQRVTSPGGTTAAGVAALQAGGVDAQIIACARAAYARAGELAEQLGQ